MDYKTIITSNSEYFTKSSIVLDILRTIGWGIIWILKTVCDAVQSVFDAAYNALNFLDSPVFKTFVSSFSVLIVAILTVSFLVIGLILMFSEKKPPVLKNALIGLAIIFILPTVITNFNAGVLGVKNEMVTGSFADQTIAANVSDISYIANQSFKFESSVYTTLGNNENATKAIDPTAFVKSSSFSTQTAKDVFNHYLYLDETTGEASWKEIGSKGMFDLFNPPYYYRYYIHYLEIMLALLANIIVYIFSAYAVIRMTYELVVTRILAALMSVELASGQKTMKVLEYFFCEYVVLFFIPVLLKVFLLWQTYVNTLGINGLTRGILILMAGLVVVDGPSIIEKIFGFDMGISSGAQKAMAFVRTVQQARMQHNMSQSRKNASKNNLASVRASQNNNTQEPNINGSENENTAAGNFGNSGGSTQEPNINHNASGLHSSTNTSNNSGGGAEQEPNINNSTMNSSTDTSAGNDSINHSSIDNMSNGADQEPNINSNTNSSSSSDQNNQNGTSSVNNTAHSVNEEPNSDTGKSDSLKTSNSINNGNSKEIGKGKTVEPGKNDFSNNTVKLNGKPVASNSTEKKMHTSSGEKMTRGSIFRDKKYSVNNVNDNTGKE